MALMDVTNRALPPQQPLATQQNVSNINKRIGNLNTSVNDGFGVMDRQLGGIQQHIGQAWGDLQQGQGALGQQMGTGFAAQNQQIGNLSNNIGDAFVATNENLGTVNNNLNNGFASVGTGQGNILAGQEQLAADLAAQGNRMNAYYEGLAGGQQGLASSLGDFQGQFGDFRDDYTRNVNQQNRAVSDLQTGLASSTQMIRNDVGNAANQVGVMQNQLSQAAGGMNVANPGPAQGEAVSPMATTINTMRATLESAGNRLDPAVASQFLDVISSFDQMGNLVPQGVDQSGLLNTRQLDAEGNLYLTKMTPDGRTVGQQVYSVPQLSQQAAQIARYTSGQTAYTRPSVTGMMAPYAMTG